MSSDSHFAFTWSHGVWENLTRECLNSITLFQWTIKLQQCVGSQCELHIVTKITLVYSFCGLELLESIKVQVALAGKTKHRTLFFSYVYKFTALDFGCEGIIRSWTEQSKWVTFWTNSRLTRGKKKQNKKNSWQLTQKFIDISNGLVIRIKNMPV